MTGLPADLDPAASDAAATDDAPPRRPVTLRTLAGMATRDEKFACLTCYDATTARWLDAAGVPVLLVGDTAAEMILGLPGTIHAPLDFLLQITAAVRRGATYAMVMGDMPFMSYQADDAEAIRNAGRFLTEGRADCVKLEVDGSFAPLVQRMARAGIPVVAHVGCRPQHAKQQGGYRAAGRTAAEARILIDDARAMEDAGASMLLVEATPNDVAQRIVDRTSIPVISCGAGTACHGQIVVLHDLLGLTEWQPPFAPPVTHAGADLVAAARQWSENVRTSSLAPLPYQMKPEDLAALDGPRDASTAHGATPAD